MILVSVGTFFLVYYLSYAFAEVDGAPISELVPFSTYMDILLQHESLVLHRGGEAVSTGELGAWGYAHALLQICGFMVGGAIIFSYLSSLPYCERCSRYLSGEAQQKRYAGDPEGFALMLGDLATAFDNGRLQEAIHRHASFGDAKLTNEHYLMSTLELKTCKQCGIRWLGFSADKRDSKGIFREITDLRFVRFHDGQLGIGFKSGAATSNASKKHAEAEPFVRQGRPQPSQPSETRPQDPTFADLFPDKVSKKKD